MRNSRANHTWRFFTSVVAVSTLASGVALYATTPLRRDVARAQSPQPQAPEGQDAKSKRFGKDIGKPIHASFAADSAAARSVASDFPAQGDDGGVANAVLATSFENTIGAGCPQDCGLLGVCYPTATCEDCNLPMTAACPAPCTGTCGSGPSYVVGPLVTTPMMGQNRWHVWNETSCPAAPSGVGDQVSSVAAVVSNLHPNCGPQHLRFQKDPALPATIRGVGAISNLLAPSAVEMAILEVDMWINEPGTCLIGGALCGIDDAPGNDCPGAGNRCVGDGVIGSQYNFRPRDSAGSNTVAANVVFAPADTVAGTTILTANTLADVIVGTKEAAAMGADPDVCVLVPSNNGMCDQVNLEFRCIGNYKTNQWGHLSVLLDPIAREVTHTFCPDKTSMVGCVTYVSCDLVSADNVDTMHMRHNNTQNDDEYMDVDDLEISIKLIPGACCDGGTCLSNVTSNNCLLTNGDVFVGPGTACGGNPCNNGRCCNNVGGGGPDGACSYTTPTGCGAGSTYFGGFPNDTCAINCCAQPVTGEDDACDLAAFPLVDPPRCVGGSNPGSPCGTSSPPFCLGGGVCTPSLPRVFSGNTSSFANVQDCPLVDMAADPDGDTRYHWEVFEITAPCVDLTIDYCCSGEETGKIRSPVTRFLVKQAGADCACDDAEDIISFTETNQSFDGTLPDICTEGNFHTLIRSLGPGRYYLPIFVADLSDDPDIVVNEHDYQLHLTATTCPIGGCCTGSACSNTNEAACRNGGGTYLGHSVACAIACGISGACCQSGGACLGSGAACTGMGQGTCMPGETCSTGICRVNVLACGDTPTSPTTYFGGIACGQKRCVGGATPGLVCMFDADCGAGATCEGVTCPPDNDKCAFALNLPNGITDFTNIGARTDGPSELCGASPNLKDVWFNHTATCDGDVTISMCNPNMPFTEYDAVISVYTDTTCPIDPITRVACDDDGCGTGGSWSTVTFSATLGQPFKVRLGSVSGSGASSEGAGEINVSCISSSACPCTTVLDCKSPRCAEDNACNHAACMLGSCTYTCVRFGDVKLPPNGVVDLDDILCLLNGFSGFANCPNGDINPCGGNGVINLDDILSVLAAFAGANQCGCDQVGTPALCGSISP